MKNNERFCLFFSGFCFAMGICFLVEGSGIAAANQFLCSIALFFISKP